MPQQWPQVHSHSDHMVSSKAPQYKNSLLSGGLLPQEWCVELTPYVSELEGSRAP